MSLNRLSIQPASKSLWYSVDTDVGGVCFSTEVVTQMRVPGPFNTCQCSSNSQGLWQHGHKECTVTVRLSGNCSEDFGCWLFDPFSGICLIRSLYEVFARYDEPIVWYLNPLRPRVQPHVQSLSLDDSLIEGWPLVVSST